jgi:glycosyltransferase involved in cell wall biosynthesis
MDRRVALVHDFLLGLRGAERVFLEICRLYPQADVVTAVYDAKGTEGRFAHRRVVTSPLQRLRPTSRTFRALLPLYPSAMESVDLSGYDLVLSSSSAWAHGVVPAPGAVHVCYCHNTFRYAWDARDETIARLGPLARRPVGAVLERWRGWDRTVAGRVDRYVANSQATRERVARHLGRDAAVLHPPVEVSRFRPGSPGDELVTVSELMPHKHLDVAVRACTALGLPLVVVGTGPDEKRLRALAGATVRFAGRLDDAAVADQLARARAVVVTAEEEFGLVAVEAQAAGRPVIALGAGGALETVVEGVTGTFYERSDPEALAEVLRGFDADVYDPAACVAQAGRFAPGPFREGLRTLVDATLDAGTAPRPQPAPA